MARKDLGSELDKAYRGLYRARQAEFLACERAERARIELEAHRLDMIRDGTITGKNTEERAASAAVNLSGHIERLRMAEEEERMRKHFSELAEIEVKRCNGALRVLEAQARLTEARYRVLEAQLAGYANETRERTEEQEDDHAEV